ncbi:hypothetical protein BDB00DRAFT_814190 [Zychaea mexicana]|uniref:uncharacterized protein n=1 Tax=Zychaea mexicana TaxID=64656 RepID=UPI0022FE1E0C|nr:uncharacterized protein BDB00DRAFT_814190 [Zychaea mexicana]KAI9495325.1 hypothetical protein BDB00DRAFT_814190 [Zychaea mexicana]
MLACVSPADADYMKTLNTLKYAGRARNIQNRVEINHDYEGSPDELDFLRTKVSQLKMQMSILQKVQNHHHQHTSHQQHQQLELLLESDRWVHEREELVRMRQYNQETSAELARVQSERDTLLAQISPDPLITEAHPVIRQYAETVEALKLQLAEARLMATTTGIAETTTTTTTTAYSPQSSTPSSMMSSSTVTHSNNSYPGLYPSHSAAVPGRHGAAASSSLDHRDAMRHIHSRPVGTLSGRRQKRKYVPIAQRMKTHSRKRGADGNNNNNTTTTTEKLIHMMLGPTNGHSMPGLSHSVHTKGQASENANNLLFVWSQSQDETVIQDISGVDLKRSSSSGSSDLFRSTERDHNENSKAHNYNNNNNGNASTMNGNAYDDESGPFCSVSCEKDGDFDSDAELEALAVPTWTSSPRAAQSTNGSTKRESLSWTDSLLDDSDNSVATSRLSSSWTSSTRQHGTSAAAAAAGRRRSKDLLKMLHQVQADLLVKKELVGQLEKSEDEYTQMRSTYEDKLNELHEHLVETEKERDMALRKRPSGSRAPVVTTHARATARGSNTGATTVMQLRETRQADDVRRLYEQKLKKLSAENQAFKQKYTQTNHTLQTARAKAEAYVGKMQSEIVSLKLEKKQMQKAAKMDADKSRDLIAHYEREIHVLKRREAAAHDARKKLEEASESQGQLLRKRNDELASMATQLRQLTLNVRRAANDGILLNQASLDRILNTTHQRATKSPIGRRATPTSE